MGKYSGVIEKLPKLRASKTEYDDPNYQHRVDEEKKKLVVDLTDEATANPPTPEVLVRRYRDLRKEKDYTEEVIKAFNLSIEALAQLITDAYEVAGVTKITLDDGENLATQPEPQAQVTDREAFRLWCLEQGHEREMVLPYGTMNAIVKDRLIAGEAEPPGVKAFVRTKLVLRKG